ncbi:MAG: papain-like cysteine protease family protein [Patescibacteria group bacterium]
MADEPTISDDSEEPTRYRQTRREFEDKLNQLRTIAGTLNKLKMVIPVVQAGIQFAFAALLALGPIAAVIMIIVVVLIAGAAFFVYYRQPSRLLRAQGTHEPEPFNGENSVDRENLLRVQSAAGLIPTLQRELIESRQLDARVYTAIEGLRRANIAEDKRTEAINLLREMEVLAKKIRGTSDLGSQDNLLQQLHALGLRFEFLTAELFLPGGSKRLKVPWRLQPVNSTTCNYYAAMMAVLYHAYDKSSGPPEKKSYPRELEEKIIAGRTDPPRSCPKDTGGYLRFAASQAGLPNAKVEKIVLGGSRSGKMGPSDQDWRTIRDIVDRTKTPVVIGTNFSNKGSHFLTIVGFSEDGREAYVNDPGSKDGRARIKLPQAYREKNSPVHLIDDERWFGGRYPNAYYLTFP